METISEYNEIRNRLIALGPEKLADMLLTTALYDIPTMRRIERYTTPENDFAETFKESITEIIKQDVYYDERETGQLIQMLEDLLHLLDKADIDPETGVALLTMFFEADEEICEKCDDSCGYLDMVYHQAADLFAKYGTSYNNKSALIEKLIDIYNKDEYSIRIELIKAAHKFLPEDSLRSFADKLGRRAEQSNSSDAEHWLLAKQEIAKQLNDPVLFEQAVLVMHPNSEVTYSEDIAKAYLAARQPDIALKWLDADNDNPQGQQYRNRNELMLAAYRQLKDKGKAAECAWRIFKSFRSKAHLETLLDIIGEEHRASILDGEIQDILKSDGFIYHGLDFLNEFATGDILEDYIMSRTHQLGSVFYGTLQPIAERMETEERWLTASIIYRTLLDNILKKGYSKAYHHGVDYLKKLDQISIAVKDWKSFDNHARYRAELRLTHGRKSSFWGQIR